MRLFLPVIKQAKIFQGIDDEDLSLLLSCLETQVKEYQKDKYIFTSGEKINYMGLILDGEALILQHALRGNCNLISKINKLETFGEEFSLVNDIPCDFSVIAAQTCIVAWFKVSCIMGTCRKNCLSHQKLLRNLIFQLAEKNIFLFNKLINISQRTTKEKLLSFLSYEAHRQKKVEFDISFNRQELADYLSVERSAMSLELSKLKNEGLINYNKNHFILLFNIDF